MDSRLRGNDVLMKFIIQNLKQKSTADAMVLVYFAKQKSASIPLWSALRAADKKQVEKVFRAKEFSGKEGEVKVLWRLSRGKIFLVGLGEKDKWNLRRLRLMARKITSVAKSEKVGSVYMAFEQLLISKIEIIKLAQTLSENAVMADYNFTYYKQNQDEEVGGIKNFILLIDVKHKVEVTAGVKVGQVIGEATNQARDLGNISGGEMTPTLLAQKAVEVGKAAGVKVEILDKKKITKLKMGAILGVANGSAEEPKFIIMEYYGADKKQAPYVFVGKGVTFDTGGLNLKPDKSMLDMHMDMLGGAAVISALSAIAKLKLPVNVIGLIPSVENMPGSAGYRPGDVLKSLSGKTIEVLNTDAEGRVILADALTYAENYKPKLIIDVATLTGACMVALGARASGLFTPDKNLQTKLESVGENSGDYVWPLPMWEEYEDEVKGTFGDVQNVGKSGGYGGAISGAMFLYQFAKKYPWAHLDIAGPMKTIEGEHLSKGASGVGVRFLVELVR